MRYTSHAEPAGGNPERIGILLVNSGTPRRRHRAAVRAFLARFLADPRVVELPRAAVAAGAVGRDPAVSAAARRAQVPADMDRHRLAAARAVRAAAAGAHRRAGPAHARAAVGRGRHALQPAGRARRRSSGCAPAARSASWCCRCSRSTARPPAGPPSTRSAASCAAGARCRTCSFVADYHDHPGYIEALRASVAAHWESRGRTAHLLMSFHGIPEDYVRRGDPYLRQCQKHRAPAGR